MSPPPPEPQYISVQTCLKLMSSVAILKNPNSSLLIHGTITEGMKAWVKTHDQEEIHGVLLSYQLNALC